MLTRLASALLALLCAACMAGQPPPPPTRLSLTAAPSASPAPAGLEPTPDFAPATPLPGDALPSPAPSPTATASLTTPLGLITPATAISLTEVARLETGQLDQAAWSPDGRLLAAAGFNGVLLFDTASLSPTRPITIGQWATSLAFDPTGNHLAVGTVGAIVQVWNLDRREPTSLLLGPGAQVARVAYHPRAGALLASLGVDNRAHLWNVDTQSYVRGLGAGLRPAYALAFSPDGDWLATAEAERVLLWNVSGALHVAEPSARSLLATASRRGAVTALAFSPAGGRLAVANTSGTIELWNPSLSSVVRSLARLNSPALALAYSPDGAVLASAHHDRSIRLWEAGRTGELLAALPGHTEAVTSLAFSPDGTRLASSSRDGTLRLWALAGPTP